MPDFKILYVTLPPHKQQNINQTNQMKNYEQHLRIILGRHLAAVINTVRTLSGETDEDEVLIDCMCDLCEMLEVDYQTKDYRELLSDLSLLRQDASVISADFNRHELKAELQYIKEISTLLR